MGWPMAGAGVLGRLCTSASFYSHGQLCPPSPHGGEQRPFRCHSQRVRAGGGCVHGGWGTAVISSDYPQSSTWEGTERCRDSSGCWGAGGNRVWHIMSPCKGPAASSVPTRRGGAVHSGALLQRRHLRETRPVTKQRHESLDAQKNSSLWLAGGSQTPVRDSRGRHGLLAVRGFFSNSLCKKLEKKYIFPDSEKPASLLSCSASGAPREQP